MLKIRFSGFWANFRPAESIIPKLLGERDIRYQIVTADEDIHVYSCISRATIGNNLNIFYSGESMMSHPDADINIGFAPNSENYFQIRNYERSHYERTGRYDVYSILDRVRYSPDKKFCLFAVKNDMCEFRNNFFDRLNSIRSVDSIGSFKRNTDISIPFGDVEGTDALLSQYNFMIAMENQKMKYYLTEKIYNAMRGGVIPIYWGCHTASDIFNPASFISVDDPESSFGIIEDIISTGGADVIGQRYVEDGGEMDEQFHSTCERLVDMLLLVA